MLNILIYNVCIFQAQSPMELDSWICSVHSACASSFARQHGKDNTLRLMKSELHKMETNIDVVSLGFFVSGI